MTLKIWSITQAICGPMLQNIWFIDDFDQNYETKTVIPRISVCITELR